MDLARFPRRRYTPWPTPIEKLAHLSRELGGPDIYLKRDDLLGLAGGGSKTRKLEFLMADALAHGADTIITVGAVQSNHCRLTLAAAIKEGLKCHLLLEERVPGSYRPEAGGNNFLYRLLGAEQLRVVAGGSDLNTLLQEMALEAAGEGRRPYTIPVGGSTPLGALGYVACAQELLSQCFDLGLQFDHLICTSGSAGTHAGLLVGLLGNSSSLPITGINVSRPRAEQEAIVHALAEQTAELAGLRGTVPREAVVCLDEWLGPGYSLPTAAMIEAVKRLARLEGILLDPVYTGKAMAGLLELVKRGQFAKGEKVLFMHTGGSPALYAYQQAILGHPGLG
jgi:D-cysteine desulfhydrase